MYLLVIPDVPKLDKAFWYVCDESIKGFNKIEVGSIVRINLHNRRVRGWVKQIEQNLDELESLDTSNIKSIIEYVSDGPPPHLIDACDVLSKYYLVSPVTFLRMCSPKRIVSLDHLGVEPYKVEQIAYLVDPRANRRELIDQSISKDGSTIIVVPDTPNKLISHYRNIGHNVVSFGEKEHDQKNIYQKIVQGNCLAIGSRSALFSPLSDCRSIIILDDSYEQLRDERSPRWHALDVAKIISKFHGANLTVITAVPSVSIKDIELIDKRTKNLWPKIYIDDKTKNDPALGMFSKQIVSTINDATQANKDSAIIVNSISASKMLVCTQCNEIAICSTCSHSITLQETNDPFLQCSFCLAQRPVICLNCNSTKFKSYRKGIKSIIKEAEKLFPKLEVHEIYKGHKVDIKLSDSPRLFIATEAILHQPQLTRDLGCCIFMDFDSIFLRPSMSAFNQSLVFVNRALRSISKTQIGFPIVISTRNPNHELISDIANIDFLSSRDRELAIRQSMNFSPFSATAQITTTSKGIEELSQTLDESLIVGINSSSDLPSMLIREHNHELLTQKAYEQLRHIASKHRYSVSIDYYD